jgi:hypothetical protein
MSRLAKVLSTLALSIIACCSARCETTNESLTFSIVSEYKVDGGRFIDTTNFPHLGYIKATPDMIVTNLADVFPAKVARQAVVGDSNGKQVVVRAKPRPTLTVKLTAGDAKRFRAVTEAALGQQLLIMLGDEPLRAPKVVAPIETAEFAIDFGSDEELQRTEKILKKLVR